MALETEIKLRLPEDSAPIFTALSRLGYQAGPRTLEVDQMYDRLDGALKVTRRLLRLRLRGTRWTLTFKAPPTTGPHKSREELETDVSDAKAFVGILSSLGFFPTFRYEKHRTTFRAEGAAGFVTLDETPIGKFLELEGEPAWIDRTAADLGFAAAEYITLSYASLYQEHRLTHPTVPEDMTF